MCVSRAQQTDNGILLIDVRISRMGPSRGVHTTPITIPNRFTSSRPVSFYHSLLRPYRKGLWAYADLPRYVLVAEPVALMMSPGRPETKLGRSGRVADEPCGRNTATPPVIQLIQKLVVCTARGGKNPQKSHFAWVVTLGFWVLGFGFLDFL